MTSKINFSMRATTASEHVLFISWSVNNNPTVRNEKVIQEFGQLYCALKFNPLNPHPITNGCFSSERSTFINIVQRYGRTRSVLSFALVF